MMHYPEFFAEKLATLKKEGRYRYFLTHRRSAEHFPQLCYTDEAGQTRQAVNWCSNDYLGMSTEAAVIARMTGVARKSGTGSGGTRNISGTTGWHRELENLLADWHNKEAALLFNGAYQANVTTLQTLGRQIPGLVFLSDEKNHASIIEGIRGCRNEKKIFRHNDMDHLASLLQELPAGQPRLIVFETVYSMCGTLAPVRDITALARKYNALTYADEVHAVGLYGPSGAGILEQEGLQADVDIVNGTLSKAIGVFGGYIAASALLVDFIRSFGSGFIFTSSLPPAVCAAAAASIKHIQANEKLRRVFFRNVTTLRNVLKKAAIPCRENRSHITILPVGNALHCRRLADTLLRDHGIYLQPINYPTVPEGEECLRLIITARHESRQIHHLAYCLKRVLYGDDPADRSAFAAFSAAAGDSETLY